MAKGNPGVNLNSELILGSLPLADGVSVRIKDLKEYLTGKNSGFPDFNIFKIGYYLSVIKA